jgi:biopolymer transport protein ExbB
MLSDLFLRMAVFGAEQEATGGILTGLFLRIAYVGAEWVLWLLLLLSFVSVAIIVDRFLFFRSNLEDDERLNAQLPEFLRAGDIKGAWELTSASDSVAAKVLTAGLQTMRRGGEACSEAMQSAKARYKGMLDARLSILGTIGANAPFVGLMGTVLGIIQAAHDLSGQQTSGGADPTKIMSGVFGALIATAVGLFVAIPAVVSYNFFQRKVRAAMAQIDSLAHLVLANVHAAEHRGASGQVPQPAKVM